MLPLLIKNIRLSLRSLAIYLLAAGAFLWMYTALFPTFAEQGSQFVQVFDTLPEALVKAFGISSQMFTNFEYFIATEHYSIVWPVIVIVLVIGQSAGAIADEIDTGTIQTLLAQPLTRTQVWWAKLLSGWAVVSAFIWGSILLVVPLAWVYDIAVQPKHHLVLALVGWLFGSALYLFGFALSSASSAKGRVASYVGGVAIVMYALNIVSKLQQSLEWLKYGSFFYYFDHQKLLVNSTVPWLGVAVFLTVMVLSVAFGWWYFVRRDLE